MGSKVSLCAHCMGSKVSCMCVVSTLNCCSPSLLCQVVSFQGELLFQGVHDHVTITLLKTEIESSTLDKYTTSNPRGMKRADIDPAKKRKTSGFGTPTQIVANCKVGTHILTHSHTISHTHTPPHTLTHIH